MISCFSNWKLFPREKTKGKAVASIVHQWNETFDFSLSSFRREIIVDCSNKHLEVKWWINRDHFSKELEEKETRGWIGMSAANERIISTHILKQIVCFFFCFSYPLTLEWFFLCLNCIDNVEFCPVRQDNDITSAIRKERTSVSYMTLFYETKREKIPSNELHDCWEWGWREPVHVVRVPRWDKPVTLLFI